DSIVGGTAAGARNVISGNAKTGVVVTFFHPANTSQFDNSINSQIVGNFIGTDVTGAVSVGNGGNGVTIGAITTTLGGTAAGARNLISGNAGNGVALISDADAPNNTRVFGNFIGTDVTGTLAVPNGGSGIEVVLSRGASIGGTTSAARNLISGN